MPLLWFRAFGRTISMKAMPNMIDISSQILIKAMPNMLHIQIILTVCVCHFFIEISPTS